ncbi:MAG: hypothetical protein KGJ86_00150 [Chloroflexota bacterium]|nr:hypothetical protein [Chloroflexota bacterium]
MTTTEGFTGLEALAVQAQLGGPFKANLLGLPHNSKAPDHDRYIVYTVDNAGRVLIYSALIYSGAPVHNDNDDTFTLTEKGEEALKNGDR